MQAAKSKAGSSKRKKDKEKKSKHSVTLMGTLMEFDFKEREKLSDLLVRILEFANAERAKRNQSRINLKVLSIMLDGQMLKEAGYELSEDSFLTKPVSISLLFKITGGYFSRQL